MKTSSILVLGAAVVLTLVVFAASAYASMPSRYSLGSQNPVGSSGMMRSYGGNGGMMGGMMGHWVSGTSSQGSGQTRGAFVTMMNYGFYPATLTVPSGTIVTWVNMDFVQHTVTSGSEQAPTSLFDSHELGHMQGFSYTFSQPGTYTYFCDLHPGMVGTIVVTA